MKRSNQWSKCHSCRKQKMRYKPRGDEIRSVCREFLEPWWEDCLRRSVWRDEPSMLEGFFVLFGRLDDKRKKDGAEEGDDRKDH